MDTAAIALNRFGLGARPSDRPPQDARAYSLYLQANAIASDVQRVSEAARLYEQCVAIDPSFAPAWARLGRVYRIIGKFVGGEPDSEERAEAALRRALELNPRLSLAHKYYAGLEADGGRSLAALSRLLDEANRHGNDPELFAGLVHACRYCGLYEQSIAAHMEARRLDPKIVTSVAGTYLMNGDLDRKVVDPDAKLEQEEEVSRVIALGTVGRREEGLRALAAISADNAIPVFHVYTAFMKAWLERRPADMLKHRLNMTGLKVLDDPEAMFQEGYMFCGAGDPARGLEFLRRSVANGYYAPARMARSPELDEVRRLPEFQKILADAEAGRAQAMVVFRQKNGEGLLGRSSTTAVA